MIIVGEDNRAWGIWISVTQKIPRNEPRLPFWPIQSASSGLCSAASGDRSPSPPAERVNTPTLGRDVALHGP